MTIALLQGEGVSLTPNHRLVDQASVFMTTEDRALVIHFSRLLRHAWTALGLFLFPATKRES